MMKKIIKLIITSFCVMVLPVQTISCSSKYKPLDKDISKWEVKTIFSNNALINAISDSSIINLKSNWITEFYRPCFEDSHNVSDLKSIHGKNKNIYFLILPNVDQKNFCYEVYIPTLPIVKSAIINYENKTKNNDSGLNTNQKIDENIDIKYNSKNKTSKVSNQIYLKNESLSKVYQDGTFDKSCIVDDNKKCNADNLLLTRVFDFSNETPGFTSIFIFMNLLIQAKNTLSSYYNCLDNVNISCMVDKFEYCTKYHKTFNFYYLIVSLILKRQKHLLLEFFLLKIKKLL